MKGLKGGEWRVCREESAEEQVTTSDSAIPTIAEPSRLSVGTAKGTEPF